MDTKRSAYSHLFSADSNLESRPTSQNSMDFNPNIETAEMTAATPSSYTGSSSSAVSWIAWHCSLPGNEYLVEIPESWIEDEFNLTGLSSMVPLYSLAIDMILDLEDEDNSDNSTEESESGKASKLRMIESSAQTLYSLLHQRFIITKAGLHCYKERLEEVEFGVCPRIGCGGCPVLPCGMSDLPGVSGMKLYCPRCQDIYKPRNMKFHTVDGCNFGTTFCHLLYLNYPELVPSINQESFADPSQAISKYSVYTPRIFGFKVSLVSPTGPSMQWLRWKEGIIEDDKVEDD
ncbi:casein kinase 2 regulatory subunit [Boothiomyces sp. JEL0838]|nr:casein kinase 2 regulatory subunit [Boothiomyces sp. JEL0838]